MKKDIFNQSLEDLVLWAEKSGFKKFVSKQIFDWLYVKKVQDFSKMFNLSNKLKDALERDFTFFSMKLKKTQISDDKQTIKFLFELQDARLIESVLILAPNRATICISSQVGCPIKCFFCASGKKGFFRNLYTSEIIEQILFVSNYLKENDLSLALEKLSNIVFMGMGEPLLNLKNVINSIKLINHRDGLNISRRRITISTVGIVDGIDELTEQDLGVNLVLSLHAPNNFIRKKITPHARDTNVKDILNSIDAYSAKTKREATFEYILIDYVNSELDHADELAFLLKDKKCCVNLIPYNPVPKIKYKRPPSSKIRAFKERLESKGLNVTQRYTKGDDIAAACGQLAILD
jgi:23S rRNA (adenine2503-C2)-methyltransferase